MLVSGDASAEAIADMGATGLDVLLKPVVAEELRLTVERLLDSAAQLRKNRQYADTKKSAPRGGAGGQTEFGMTG